MLHALSAFCVFPLRLYSSLPRTPNWLFSLMSASCLGLRPPAAMTNGKLSLQLIFVTLTWGTTIKLSFLELAEEDCFGHAYVFHPCDVASPAKLYLKQDELSNLVSVVSVDAKFPGKKCLLSISTFWMKKSNDEKALCLPGLFFVLEPKV